MSDGTRVTLAMLFDDGTWREHRVDVFNDDKSNVIETALDTCRRHGSGAYARHVVVISSRPVSYRESADEAAENACRPIVEKLKAEVEERKRWMTR